MLSVLRTINRRPLFQASRALSTSRLLLQKAPKDSKPQSILTDDMLERAGMDTDKPTSNDAKSSGAAAAEGAERTKSKRVRKTSTDIKREKYANWMYIFSFSALAGSALYLTRDWEEGEPEEMTSKVENGYAPSLMYQRFKLRWNSMFTYFQEPPFPDLLPDSPPAPYKRPLTLVLSLEDLLVHSEWTQKHGWRTAKRPGVDYFLGYLSQYYEIVLFSSNYMMYSERVVEKLDPLHAFISYNLYKEHCVYKDGSHIKDLSKLNRDVGKVIIVDTDPSNYQLQPDNAIPMKPWDGTPDDKLIQLIPFLEYIATQQPGDVKPILNSFHNKEELPQEFQVRVQKLREKFEKEQSQKLGGNWALKLLGVAPGAGSGSSGSKFPLDMIREEGEKNYVRFMQMIEEEKAKMKIQQEQMSGQTFTLKDYVEGNIPTPEEQMQKQLEKQKEVDELFEQQKKESAGK